ASAAKTMAQPMKAAFQSMGIGVSIASRCNVASTLVAEADTTGVHGLPMTKPKYLASSAPIEAVAHASQLGRLSGLSPTALKAPDDPWMVVRPFGSMQASKFPYA
ncbi:MAG TPA: hypothetical protein VFO36_11410, partial [Nitrospiraceae bacterium]|nr:hypothetical protein [Nitrospiraceae bacterium]